MKIYAFTAILIFTMLIFASCNKDTQDVPSETEPTVDTIYQQYGTPFAGLPNTEDIVLYEVNLRAYSPGGDLQGVINRLDDIAELGVNVIWLMPIYPIGEVNSVNSPYSVKDYKAVSSEYGTLKDLRVLTKEAHSRGMAVILDWVANHTAWDNEWIKNKSWYSQDASGNIIHPPGTNWQDVADLNFDNQSMRQAMREAMLFWVYQANIDGFRCDYADGVPFDFWHKAFQTIDTVPNRDFIYFAEGSRSDHFNAGFDLNFSWNFYGTIKDVFNGQSVIKLFNANINEYENTPMGKHWVRFTTNHDESAWDATPISIFNGVDGALAASVVTIFTGGVPLIYGSQEVGTAGNVPFFTNSTINWNDNPEMYAAYQKMLQFYSSSDVAKIKDNLHYQSSDVVFFKKTLDEKELLIIVNVRNETINYTLHSDIKNTAWIDINTENGIVLSNQITLQAYQYYILIN
ncbi:MAG: alpha-amylase [Marinilabiliales bacterium]|nr:MAG: alpha-amylase [Marinilabiliales bacterium]